MSYFKQLFILAFVVTECISISVFVVIVSSKVAMKTCPNTASIKMQKSIITKRRKKKNKIVLQAKAKLNSIDVLISKDLTHVLVMVIDYGRTFKKRRDKKHMNAWGAYYVLVNIFITEWQ